MKFQRMVGDVEEQEDELLALSTILEPSAFNYSSTLPHTGSIDVQVGGRSRRWSRRWCSR